MELRLQCRRLLILLLAVGGCHPSTNKVEFGNQVRQWVPIGTGVDDAQRVMEAKRFDVDRLRAEPWWQDQRDLLFCTHHAWIIPPIPVIRRWKVILYIENEQIAEVWTDVYGVGP